MTGFTPAAVHSPSIAVTATVSSFIEYIYSYIFIFLSWHLFTITIGCILSYSVNKIHPLAQVRIHPLLDTVQGINCINFDNFRATQRFVRGHNPAYIMHVSPPLLYSDLSVLSLLSNDVVGPCVTTT